MEEFDLFTFIATIVNFMVLVFLLRIFLYDRVLKTIEKRQKQIEERWDEAEEERNSAEAERQDLESKRKELEENEERLRRDAQEKARQVREELVRRAKQELGDTKKDWFEAFEKEKDRVVSSFEREAAYELTAAVREVMKDLADTDLEEAIIWQFLDKCEEKGIGKDLQGAEEVVVRSGFPIKDGLKDHIVQSLSMECGGEFDRSRIRFFEEAELVCGIELEVQNKKITWNVDRYLREAAEELSEKVT